MGSHGINIGTWDHNSPFGKFIDDMMSRIMVALVASNVEMIRSVTKGHSGVLHRLQRQQKLRGRLQLHALR
jgi:hypothetical protein